MDTVGTLIDKITIAEKRLEVCDDNEVEFSIKQQIGWMLLEIAHSIIDGYSGSRPLSFKKHKVYDKSIKDFAGQSVIGITGHIQNLKEYNHKLWELEDIRRDKTLSDMERLEAADEVSVFNKKRNDCMDNIDSVIESYIKSIVGSIE